MEEQARGRKRVTIRPINITGAGILCAALCFMLTACAGAGKIPGWVNMAPQDNDNLYFVGIKTGTTLEVGKKAAIKQAVAELVEHFEIRSNSTYQERKTELETKIFEEIATHSGAVKVKGVLIKDWHFIKAQKGTYDVYVLLQYPKYELNNEISRIRNEDAQKARFIKMSIRQGSEARAKGDIITAYESYVYAMKKAEEAEENTLYGEALSEIISMLEILEISKISGDKQKAGAFAGLKKPLEVKVFFKIGASEIPVDGVLVIFSGQGKSSQEESVVTDSSGIASFRNRGARETGIHRASATIDLKNVLSEPQLKNSTDKDVIAKYIDNGKVTVFSYEVFKMATNIRVSLSIDGVERASTANFEITKRLTEAGYEVVSGKNEDADFRIDVGIRTFTGEQNLFWTISALADGNIRAINNKTGKVIAQKSLAGIRGFGSNTQLAETDAIRKIGSKLAEGLLDELN